jgi:hypothetical protein
MAQLSDLRGFEIFLWKIRSPQPTAEEMREFVEKEFDEIMEKDFRAVCLTRGECGSMFVYLRKPKIASIC